MNDLIYSVKNKGFYLILFIPLFIFVSENLLDKNRSDPNRIKLAVLENATDPQQLLTALKSSAAAVELVNVETVAAGEERVRERKADGFLNGETLIVDETKVWRTRVG